MKYEASSIVNKNKRNSLCLVKLDISEDKDDQISFSLIPKTEH